MYEVLLLFYIIEKIIISINIKKSISSEIPEEKETRYLC
jgi:hypothetical protein